MNAKDLANLLNGRSIGNEISSDEAKLAKAHNLVVAFGASDDLVEFEGAIHDEAGAPGSVIIANGEIVKDVDEWNNAKAYFMRYGIEVSPKIIEIDVKWCPGTIDASWLITTDSVEFESFDIFEEGDLYCRGIVFSLESAIAS